MNNNQKSLLVVCGELSSDHHTAPVIESLLQSLPDLKIYGMGGSSLRKAGMELLVDAEKEASVMGFTEVLAKIPRLLAIKKELENEVDKRGTKVALLVDFPDFNLRLAKQLKKRGMKIIYFISPQLWAWRKGRIKQIKKYIDKVIPIFPFEESFYKPHGVDATYLGHPFLDKPPLEMSREDFCKDNDLDPNKPILGLLPGSRSAEVKSLLPLFNELYRKLRVERPDLQIVIPVAASVRHQVRELAMDGIKLIYGSAREVLEFSRASIVASGTATVEAALAGNPFLIVYKVSPLTYRIGKILITGVKYIGMPNLIANRKIVEEFLQEVCTVENILKEVNSLLDDESKRARIQADLDQVKLSLGSNDNEKLAIKVARVVESYL